MNYYARSESKCAVAHKKEKVDSAPDGNGVDNDAASPINSATSGFQMFESEEEGDTNLEDVNMSESPADVPEAASHSGQKRCYNHDENNSSANPTKKLQFKATSYIRIGLEKGEAADGKKPGLFQYFRKASQEDKKEYNARTNEELKERMEKVLLEERKAKQAEKKKIQDANRERKRRQRKRRVNLEIKSGLRSPGGTKHQVGHTFYKFVHQ